MRATDGQQPTLYTKSVLLYLGVTRINKMIFEKNEHKDELQGFEEQLELRSDPSLRWRCSPSHSPRKSSEFPVNSMMLLRGEKLKVPAPPPKHADSNFISTPAMERAARELRLRGCKRKAASPVNSCL